jgi:uncharacterized protein (TIGR02246 family)
VVPREDKSRAMKTSPRLLASVILALLALPTLRAADSAETEVRAEFARWTAAYRAHDLAGTMAIFDPGVRFAFQGGPDSGYAELRRGYEQEFRGGSTAVWVGAIDEVIASGDVAAEFSTWQLVDPTGRVLEHNRGMDLFRRDAHGRWRIIRSLNYPVAAPTAAGH